MNRSFVLPVAIAAVFVAGCAPMDQQSSAEPRSDMGRVTGSRLPTRDSTSSEVRTTENRAVIDDIVKNRNIEVPGKKGPQ